LFRNSGGIQILRTTPFNNFGDSNFESTFVLTFVVVQAINSELVSTTTSEIFVICLFSWYGFSFFDFDFIALGG